MVSRPLTGGNDRLYILSFRYKPNSWTNKMWKSRPTQGKEALKYLAVDLEISKSRPYLCVSS